MHYITIEKKVTKAKTITFMQYNFRNCFCFLFFVTACFFIPQTSFAQKVDSTKDVTAKHPKAAKVVKNILYGLSFLHYTDRKKDRILDGAEDFEQYRGKKLNAIHYRSLKPYGVSIENPDSPVTKKAAKFANGIHIPTKPKVSSNIYEDDHFDIIFFFHESDVCTKH